MKNMTAAVLSALVALSLVLADVEAPTPSSRSAEPELVAVGEDVELAHTTKDCRLYTTRTSMWISYYENIRFHNGSWYVTHWHQPRLLNVFGRAHVNVSKCSGLELRRLM